MYGKKRRMIFTALLLLCVSSLIVSAKPMVEGTPESYFTLVAKTHSGDVSVDYLNLIKQQLAQIGINLEVIIQTWPEFVGELLVFRNFDLCSVAIDLQDRDPDMTGVYNENGSLNLFGYHTDMDSDDALGTGKNEWYMHQGNLIMPPNSEERIQHYWDWEQYLMDEILPMKPLLAPNNYEAHWSNLNGYNYSDGILQSWGKMNWSGSHAGQISTDELVIADAAWSDLNPLFQDDTSSKFISSAILDPLFWYDSDNSFWPHLAKSLVHLNDSHVRITLREGIKWQPDPDGNFTDEYLDAEDVYFSIDAWSYVSGYNPQTFWLEEMKIIDKYTLDLFIDWDSSTPENDPHAAYMSFLDLKILPEFYLNQTQNAYSGLPDVTHPSWYKFATHCFGTGLFELTSYNPNTDTILNVFPDCWRMNASITNDPALNWNERFGDFTGGLDQLRIRQISDYYTILAELEQGRVDIESVTDDDYRRAQYVANPDFTIESKIYGTYLNFIGYNMRPVRPVIGSYDPWFINHSISKGLAIRKAISYAINVDEINQIVHGGEYTQIYHPIPIALGVWCNPNIIKYNYDLDKAKEYLPQDLMRPSTAVGSSYYPLFIISEALLCIVFLLKKERKNSTLLINLVGKKRKLYSE